jgi:hypothetical protein
MRRAAALLLLAFALRAETAGAQWGEPPLPIEAGVRCPADAGGGRVALLDPSGRNLTLWRTGADGLHPDGALRVPSAFGACPAVAVAADGAAVVAVALRTATGRTKLAIARRAPGGAFRFIPAPVPPKRIDEVVPAAAVAPGGGGVVAWGERRSLGPTARLAVRAIRIAPDGSAASLETLMPRTTVDAAYGFSSAVLAGADGAGGATVAWLAPRPPQRDGRVGGLAAVDVAAAPAGAPFGAPQRLTENVQDVADLDLVVAGDGRALLAHDGSAGIAVFERAPGAGFASAGRYATGSDIAPPRGSRPAVGLAQDGSAVVAWRERGRIHAIARAGAGPFGAPVAIAADARAGSLGFAVAIVEGPAGSERDAQSLDAAVGPGGSAVVTWIARPALPGAPFGAAVATASAGAFVPPAAIGGVVRDVRAAVPVLRRGRPRGPVERRSLALVPEQGAQCAHPPLAPRAAARGPGAPVRDAGRPQSRAVPRPGPSPAASLLRLVRGPRPHPIPGGRARIWRSA